MPARIEHEKIARIEKLAEWRGFVQTTLTLIKDELAKVHANNKEFERVHSKAHFSFQTELGRLSTDIETFIKEEIENRDAFKREFRKKFNGLYVKVISLGTFVGGLTYLVLHFIFKQGGG